MAELIKKINGKEVYANRVDNDQNGDNIVSTYAKKTEIPSVEGLASVDYVDSATSGKLDTSAFDREITAYALKSEVPSIEGLMEESKLEYKNNQITGYNGSAFAGQGGGSGITASVDGVSVDSLEIITDNPGEQYREPTNPTINGEELHIYYANYADHADNADNANNADHAYNANNANHADYADNANNADYASNADNAGTLDYHPASDFVMHTDFEYDGDVITGCNGSAFGGQGGHEYTGIDPIVVDNDNNTISADTIELVAGDGIDITDGVISCTATSIDYNIVIEDI